jgi:hypothetical protein
MILRIFSTWASLSLQMVKIGVWMDVFLVAGRIFEVAVLGGRPRFFGAVWSVIKNKTA